MEKYIPLGIGISCLITGIILYYKRPQLKHLEDSLNLAWLLIAIFPVFIIFSIFPDSTITGKMFNFSFGGAIGAFFLIWRYGVNRSIKAVDLKKLKIENEKLKKLVSNSSNNQKPKHKAITRTEKYTYSLNCSKEKKIGLITGNIHNIKDIDIWVNSENTNMQMARFYEASISANIRYMGATKDKVGNVIQDTISDHLKKQVGENLYVHPGTVLVTDTGELFESHGVKKIFHVASVQGEVGSGYSPVKNIHNCIKNPLLKFDELDLDHESILFPLLGTGTAKGSIIEIGDKLFEAAISYLEQNRKSKLREIYFLAYTDIQLEVCIELLNKKKKIKKNFA